MRKGKFKVKRHKSLIGSFRYMVLEMKRPFLVVSASLVISILASLLLLTNIGQYLSTKGYDALLKARYKFVDSAKEPNQSSLAIIAIDDFTISNPRLAIPEIFQHHYYAEIVASLDKAGAKAVVLNMMLPRSDSYFTSTLDVSEWFRTVQNAEKHMPVLSGMWWQDDNNAVLPGQKYVQLIGPDKLGFLNLIRDHDDRVRKQFIRWPQCSSNEEPGCFSLVWLAAKTIDPSLQESGVTNFYIEFDPDNKRAVPHFSFLDIYQRAVNEEIDFFERHFKDKLVLIGEANSLSMSSYHTPFSEGSDDFLSALEINAQSILTLLDGQQIFYMESHESFVFVFLSTLISLSSLLLSPKRGPYKMIWLPSVCIAMMLAISITAFAFGFYLPFTTSFIAMVLAQLFYLDTKVYEEREVNKTTMTALGLYLSPLLAKRIVDNPKILSRSGVRKEMTIFFSDLSAFTSMAESLSPEKLVFILNRYFERMSPCIEEFGGILDKYGGDSIMAFWGSPLLPKCEHQTAAVLSALKQQDELKILNKELSAEGLPRLTSLMGINTGQMVVGNIGSATRLNYTVMGDAVNLASRLVAANKIYRSRILISEDTAKKAVDVAEIRTLDRVVVPGRQESLFIYEVLARKGELGAVDSETKQMFEASLRAYFQRDFEKAAQGFEDVLLRWPKDVPSVILRARCRDFIRTPPPNDWNAVTRLSVK